MKTLFIFILCLTVLTGCTCREDSTDNTASCNQNHARNIYEDPHLKKIATLQNQRDLKALLPYLKDTTAEYRQAAAAALASVQAPESITPLSLLFADPDENVRKTAAYALGQVRDKSAEAPLLEALEKETRPVVKRHILEALGKCATKKALEHVIAMKVEKEDPMVITGQAYALYRFVLQKIFSDEGTAKILSLLEETNPKEARLIAANYLARAREIDIKSAAPQLIKLCKKEKDIFIKMNMVAGLGKAATPEALTYLDTLLKGEDDYRVKVNALRALSGFEYQKAKEPVIAALPATNHNVATAAAEWFKNGGNAEDARMYFDTAKGLTRWRIRTTMLSAALKYAPKENNKLRKIIRDFINAAYKKSINDYEKAWLLEALQYGDYDDHIFLETQAFSGKSKVIGTYAVSALAEMSRKAKEDDKKRKVFASIFEKAVAAGDTAQIGLAAGILRDPDLNFKKTVTDTTFLTTALAKCTSPKDIEARLELERTIAFFAAKEGDKTPEKAPEPGKPKAIDWTLAASIASNHEVTIKTSKGDIVIRLFIDEAPGSVVNFLQLIKEGLYKSSIFHRVVPNFVIQDGCPRGDGWGGPTFTIGSEFAPLHYREGSVGMASAGKDTEGSQWFITHSPTPHLDGRYTIFGKVVSGMDVVHQIEVGDRILAVSVGG
ncbi:MAG: hypothetical protein GY765_16740 [bacterium]|nr:hypothetical protein [bacterium]